MKGLRLARTLVLPLSLSLSCVDPIDEGVAIDCLGLNGPRRVNSFFSTWSTMADTIEKKKKMAVAPGCGQQQVPK